VILQQVLRAGDESITPLFAPPAILRFLPFTQIRAAPPLSVVFLAAPAVRDHVTTPGRPSHPERQVLSRELSDFLLDILGAFQRFTMYPEGHPLLDPAVANVMRRLEILFLERASVPIGVAPTQLLVAGVPTDPKNALLRDLAERIYRHNIGAIKILRGVQRAEIVGLLTLLKADPGLPSGPAVPDAGELWSHWPHLRLFPLTYDHLALLDDALAPGAEEAEERFGSAWASRVWLSLARATLGYDTAEPAAVSADPRALAGVINARPHDAVFDERVTRSLAEFTEACRGRGKSEALALQRHISTMLGTLNPETLERLMRMGEDVSRRRKFIVDASQVVSVDVIVELVKSAGRASDRTVSPALLQVLSKLAAHAEDGATRSRSRADESLRRLVRQMTEEWSEPDAGPLAVSESYRRMLDELPRAAPSAGEPVRAYAAEPERIIMMSLELGVVEAGTLASADWLLGEGRIAQLLDLLDPVPMGDGVANALRERVFSRHTVALVLSREPVDLDTLLRLVPATGPEAIAPLLDALATARDRKVRARLLDLLAKYGATAGPEAAARIDGAPWYVQRNLLKLLSLLPELPPEFSPDACLAHPDPRVRHEGLRLLLRDPRGRAAAIEQALRSPDAPTVRLGLMAAGEGCPRPAVPLLLRLLAEGKLEPALRAVAIRAIAPLEDPAVLDCLVETAVVRGPLSIGRRLAPKSPALMAALAGLAAHWPYHPMAAPILAMAFKQRDWEIREAAASRPDKTPETPPHGPTIIVP
jgi:hypothetical protein